MRRPFIGLSALVFFYICLLSTLASAADLTGQVVDETNNKPVIRAIVNVDGKNHQTDSLGMWKATDLSAGSVTVRVQHPAYQAEEVDVEVNDAKLTKSRIELIPAAAPQETAWVDFSVIGVVSNLQLPASITVRRFESASDSGGGTIVAELTADQFGIADLEVEDGFYRFEFDYEYWEPFSVPSPNGVTEITSDTQVSVALEPVKFDMPFLVRGSRPEGDPISGGIDDAVVEIVGVDPNDPSVELTPRQQLITDSEGRVTFEGLPVIAYAVEIKKPGYKTWEDVIFEIDIVAQNEIQPVFQLDDTTIEVEFLSDYDLSGGKNPGIAASIKGMPGTGAEGVFFSFDAADIEGDRLVKRYERILPGMYDVEVRQSGIKRRTSIEVGADELAVVTFDGTPAKMSVSGTLRLVNALRPSDQTGTQSEVDRVFDPPAQPIRIVFQGSQVKDAALSAPWFKPEWRYETTSDALGRFQIDLPKGRYGIELPDLTGYTGYQIQVRGRYDTAFASAGWPFPQPWPFGNFQDQSVVLDQDTYTIDLEVHRNFTDVLVPLRPQGATDYRNFFISQYVGEGSGGILAVEPVLATWTGPQEPYPLDDVDDAFVVEDVGEGMFTASGAHSLFSFMSMPVDTTNQWGAFPGDIPPSDPASPGYIPPGLRHGVSAINGPWPDDPAQLTPVSFTAQQWCQSCNSGLGQYNPASAAWLGSSDIYVELAAYAEVLWRTDKVPSTNDATVWIRDGSTPTEQWYAFANATPGQVFGLFIGGPSATTFATPPPVSGNTSVQYTVIGVDAEGNDPGIEVDFDDNLVTTGGAPVLLGFPSTNPVSNDPRYSIVEQKYELISVNPPEWVVTLTLSRQMAVTGLITLEDGEMLPPSKVEIFGADGRLLASQDLPAEGSFTASVERQPIWIRSFVPGYVPVQRRFDPPTVQEDLTGVDIVLPLATPAQIDSVSGDRYGIYIPGVLLSADPLGANLFNGNSSLTATFRVNITPAMQRPTYDQFPYETDLSSNTYLDDIVEVWIIDQREFENGFLESDSTDAKPLPINPANPNAWIALKDSIQRGIHPTEPRRMNVAHARATPNPDGSFTVPVELWNMPPGTLDLVAVAVSKTGAVAVAPYSHPDGAPPLQGASVGEWGATFLNIIGFAANFQGDTRLAEARMKKRYPQSSFIPSGVFSGTIGDEVDPRWSGGYVTYDFRLGVKWSMSMDNASSGLVSVLPKDLGFKVGGELALKADGRSGSLGLDGSGVLTASFSTENQLGVLGFAAKEAPFDIEIEGTGKAVFGSRTELGSGGLFPGYTSKFSIKSTVETTLTAPVTSLLKLSGPVAYIVADIAQHADLKLLAARLNGGVGGEMGVKQTFETTRFQATTTTRASYGAFGTTESVEEADTDDPDFTGIAILLLKAGIELGIDLKWVSGYMGVQLGNQADSDKWGLELTPNTDSVFPLFKRVFGAVSITGKFAINLPFLVVGRTYQWDAQKFDWQFGTDPLGEVLSGGQGLVVRSSLTSLPGEWLNQDRVLVGNYFSGGGFDADYGLAFTNTDPVSGEMSLFWAGMNGTNYAEPELVATAKGIDDVVVVPGDTPTLVWTQIDAFSDVGNAFAQNSVMSASLGGDGWEAPVLIEDVEGYASDLTATASGVAWSVRTESAVSSLLEVRGSAFDGTFGNPESLHPAAEIGGFRAVGDSVYIIEPEGGLVETTFNQPGQPVFDGQVSGLTNYPGTDVFLVIADRELGLGVWDTSQDPWQEVLRLAPDAPRSLDAAKTGSNVTLAWLANNEVSWAVLDPAGGVVQDVEALPRDGDFYGSLRLNETESGPARFILTQTEDFAAHLVEFELEPGKEPLVPGATPDGLDPLENPMVDINDGPDDPNNPDDPQDPDMTGSSADSGGCCRVIGASPSPVGLMVLFFVAGVLLRRRVRDSVA